MSWISWIAGPKVDERRVAITARIEAVNESLERTAWKLRGQEDKTDRRSQNVAVLVDKRKND